jgi:hypothetical protein
MSMTASAEGGEESRLNEDPLVAALIPDPAAGPPDTTVLHGYLGKSTSDRNWRLYLDATLTSYVEVSEDDIMHHRQLAADGGTLVWVPKSLELTVTRISSATVQAEFLSGAISAGRMRPTQHSNAASPPVGVQSVGCPSILNDCLSQILPCPTDGCVSWDFCPTVVFWCRPSEFRPLCSLPGLC